MDLTATEHIDPELVAPLEGLLALFGGPLDLHDIPACPCATRTGLRLIGHARARHRRGCRAQDLPRAGSGWRSRRRDPHLPAHRALNQPPRAALDPRRWLHPRRDGRGRPVRQTAREERRVRRGDRRVSPGAGAPVPSRARRLLRGPDLAGRPHRGTGRRSNAASPSAAAAPVVASPLAWPCWRAIGPRSRSRSSS